MLGQFMLMMLVVAFTAAMPFPQAVSVGLFGNNYYNNYGAAAAVAYGSVYNNYDTYGNYPGYGADDYYNTGVYSGSAISLLG